jgi:hypothetical protein
MRKCIPFLVVVVLAAIPAAAQVPKTVVAEDGTATWCGYCPDAYAGLDQMHVWHPDPNDFVSVRYYASPSSGFYTAEMATRVQTYGLTGYPTVWFQGTLTRGGGGYATSTGYPYQALWEQSLGPSPFTMKFQIFNPSSGPGTGQAQVRIDCVSPPGDISKMVVKIVVYEDAVPYNDPSQGFRVHYEVARDILDPVMLSTANPGEFQIVDKTFPVDPTWVVSNLHAIAFIQEEGPNTAAADDPIWQACKDDAPQYSVTYYPAGDRNKVVMVPLNAPYSFGDIAICNAGNGADTITVRLTTDRSPAGWTAEFTDGTSTYTDSVQVPLDPIKTRTFHVNVTPTTADYGIYRLEMFSNNLPTVVKSIK